MMLDHNESYISPFRRSMTLGLGAILAVCLLWSPLQSIMPFNYLAIGMNMMATFFHELGHTFFAWIFGYPTLPSFDFQYGGGMAWHFGRAALLQYGAMIVGAYGAFLVWRCHAVGGIMAAIAVVALAIVSLLSVHESVILFMGNGAEIVVGSYILTRVVCDAVPPRPGELEVHALAGWFLVCDPIRLSWGLIFDADARDAYWHQKGSEGFGDFSRIADYFGYVNETPVAWFCILLACAGIIAPFVIQFMCRRQYSETW